MKKLTVEYDSRKEFQNDEDLRLKGIAFDRLDSYFRSIIRNGGASAILASLNIKQSKHAENLVYELSEYFRKHLNSVYKDESNS